MNIHPDIETYCKYHNIYYKKNLFFIRRNLDNIFYWACAKNHRGLVKYLVKRFPNSIKNDVINLSFFEICQNNRLELAIYLFQQFGCQISDKNYSLLISSVKMGNLIIIRWLYSLPKGIILTRGYRNIETITKIFRVACFNGKLNIAKWIYDSYKSIIIEDTFFAKKLLGIVTTKGLLDMIKWFYEIGLVDSYNYRQNLFEKACRGKNLELTMWIHSQGGIDIHNNSDYPFRIACGGYLETAKWLYLFGEIDIHSNNEGPFHEACEKGKLVNAQWLYSLGGVNIHALEEYAFRIACEMGHLAIGKWLLSLGRVNIHILEEYSFVNACINGNLEIAKWLYKVAPINVNAQDNTALISACEWGEIDIVRWLITLNKFDINYCDDLAFRTACSSGNGDVAKLLLESCDTINVSALNDSAFIQACVGGHLDIAQWLYYNFEIDIRSNNDEAFRITCDSYIPNAWAKSRLRLIEWLTHEVPDYDYTLVIDKVIPKITDSLLYYKEQKMWSTIIALHGIEKNIELEIENCCICYEKGNIMTHCGHSYCIGCLVEWFLKKRECAYCKDGILLKDCITNISPQIV